MWFVNRVRRLFGQNNSCRDTVPSEVTVPPTATQNPVEGAGAPAAGVTISNEDANKLFYEAMKSSRLHEHQILFRISARPIGFSGSNVVCDVTRKYRIGTRIIRSDGRLYEVFKVKRTKRTRIEATGPMPVWGALT